LKELDNYDRLQSLDTRKAKGIAPTLLITDKHAFAAPNCTVRAFCTFHVVCAVRCLCMFLYFMYETL